MADRISAHRYYDGSDSCQASPRPAGLLAYLAHTSQRSASNHKGDPDIALHAISAYPMCFRLRPLLASSPSLPAESSSLSCGPPVRLQLLSTPPRSDAVTFGYRVLAYPGTDFHRAGVAPSRAHSSPRKRGSINLWGNWLRKARVLPARNRKRRFLECRPPFLCQASVPLFEYT